MQGLLILKGTCIKKDQREFLCASIFIKNVSWPEKTSKHKAVRPSNYFSNSFTYDQAEQIKKRSHLCPNFVGNTPY